MDALTRFKINRPIVVDEVFDDEVVIIHFDTGNYYTLDSVGTEIWGLIGSGASVSETVQSLVLRYDDSQDVIEEAMTRFLAELQKEDLVAVSEPRDRTTPKENVGRPEAIGATSGRRFHAPVLSRYTEMQDLLLLDPIHEVDEAGWPSVKAAPPDED